MVEQNWVFAISRQNWTIVKDHSVWATNYEHITHKVKPQDRLVLYVVGLKVFKGIFEAEGEFYKAKEPFWSDELKEGRVKYPYQIKVKELQTGNVPLEDVIERLSFIKVKPFAGIYFQRNPANYGKPIDQSDYDVILGELRQRPEPTGMRLVEVEKEIEKVLAKPVPGVADHDGIIDTLTTVGDIFGSGELLRKPEVNELRPSAKQFKAKVKHLDLAWKFGMSWIPFEVQVHGNVPDLIYRFNLVHQWSHRLVVVAEPQFHEEIKEAAQDYPFAEKIVVLEPLDIFKASTNLPALLELRRMILG